MDEEDVCTYALDARFALPPVDDEDACTYALDAQLPPSEAPLSEREGRLLEASDDADEVPSPGALIRPRFFT